MLLLDSLLLLAYPQNRKAGNKLRFSLRYSKSDCPFPDFLVSCSKEHSHNNNRASSAFCRTWYTENLTWYRGLYDNERNKDRFRTDFPEYQVRTQSPNTRYRY
jgi:hypothetical protein